MTLFTMVFWIAWNGLPLALTAMLLSVIGLAVSIKCFGEDRVIDVGNSLSIKIEANLPESWRVPLATVWNWLIKGYQSIRASVIRLWPLVVRLYVTIPCATFLVLLGLWSAIDTNATFLPGLSTMIHSAGEYVVVYGMVSLLLAVLLWVLNPTAEGYSFNHVMALLFGASFFIPNLLAGLLLLSLCFVVDNLIRDNLQPIQGA